MKKKIVLMAMLALLVGCQGSPIQTGWEAGGNRKAMLGLSIGQSKADVVEVMGQPRKTEAYSRDGTNIEFWLYLTEGVGINRKMTDEHFTPLVFENGKLAGWGRNYYVERTQKYDIKIDQTIEQK
ncbi:MAG: DUF3192 domain-containing protein [Planctomycetes bacterium]|nr:DUF3192 domain-containing protein [Planctomycetota bacterium]